MRHHRVLLPLLGVGLTFLPCGAYASAQAASPAALHEQRRIEAMVGGDLAALDRLLADDLIYTHSTGQVETKGQFLEGLRSGRMVYRRFDREDVRVRRFGDTAVITGRAIVELRSAGQELKIPLRFTDVWVRRRGRWQMVAWQSTRIAE